MTNHIDLAYEQDKECKCKDCEFADKVYYKDEENGQFFTYPPSTIILCMKHNKFIVKKQIEK